MKRLSLYLFRQIALTFLFTCLAVVFVVLFTQSFRLLSFVIDNSGTMIVFFQLMGLMMLTFLPVLCPISLGIATVFIYNKLAVESELVVMRSIGISPFFLARPAIVAGFLIMAFCYSLTLSITPWANNTLVNIQYKVRDNMSVFLIKSGAFNDLSDGVTFYSKKRGVNGELEDIMIHDVRNSNRPVTIMAENGQFVLNENNVPQVIVYKGRRQEINPESGKLSELNFDRYVLDLQVTRDKSNVRLPDPREMTMDMLAEKLDEPEEIYKSDSKDVKAHTSHGKLFAEFHQRLTSPLLALCFSLIGVTSILAGPFNRRGMTKRIVLAATSIIVLQALALSLNNLMAKQSYMAILLYAIVLAPIPLCMLILGLDYLEKKSPKTQSALPPVEEKQEETETP